MKKFFTLFAAAIMAVSASAQIISFTEDDKAAAGTLNEKTFSKDGFALTITDVVDGGKVNLDANNALFGTLDNYVQFTHRLKSGGKRVQRTVWLSQSHLLVLSRFMLVQQLRILSV